MAESGSTICFHEAVNELPAWLSYQMLGELNKHHNGKKNQPPLQCFPVSRIKIQLQIIGNSCI